MMAGPRLQDDRFFSELIDTSRPGLQTIPALVAAGDFGEARKVFAADARASVQPERFPYPDQREHNSHLIPGETYEKAAERILRLELVSCGMPQLFVDEVDWFANPTYNQYKEWTWQLSRHVEFVILAERYRETGEERFAEAFVKLFCSWARQAVVPLDQPGNATKTWRTIEAGIRMGQTWPPALHTFINAPAFSDDVLVDWYKSVWEHGWRLRNFHRQNNWLIMEMNGLAQIGILYPQFKESPAWKDYAIDRLIHEFKVQNFADGFQFELTTGYHQVNIRNYQILWNLMDAFDEPVPQVFRDEMEKMHTVNVQLMMPDGRLPDINDGGWQEVAPLMTHAVRCYPERQDFKWAAGQGGQPPAQTSLALGYSGQYVMRTGWEPDAVWALLDGGPLGVAHQHEDKLNLLVHAYGRLLLTEGGNYAYDDSEMRRYVLSTRSHNTVRVDGLDQNRKGPFHAWWEGLSEAERIEQVNTPNPATWNSTNTYDMAAAVYDEGYGPEALPLVTHERKVIFLKRSPLPGPCFVVIDTLTPKDDAEHEYQILWHFNTETAEADDALLAVQSEDAAQPNLAIMAAPQPNLSVLVVVGQEEPEWQGWKSPYHGRQGTEIPAPTADYRLTGAGPQRVVTLVYPLPVGAECPVARVETDGDATRIVLRDGRRVRVATMG